VAPHETPANAFLVGGARAPLHFRHAGAPARAVRPALAPHRAHGARAQAAARNARQIRGRLHTRAAA
jgi:hypothetical protein